MRCSNLSRLLVCAALLPGCSALYPNMTVGPALRIPAPPYALPDGATFSFDDTAPGATSAVDAGASFPSGILETYQIDVTLPGAFTFDGFTATGPAGTVIATYEFVTQAMTIPLRALTHDTAFADLYQDTHYDPGVDVLVTYLGNGAFRVTMPNGGDDQPLSTTAGFDAQVAFHLLAGILHNPATAGSYDLHATFTSVDPDGDGADDHAGTAPSQFETMRAVAIACTAAAECDDRDACTIDTCDGGTCQHGSSDAGAHLDCALAQLADASLCAPDPIVAGFEKFVQKKVAAARKAVAKLPGTSAKAHKRLLNRIKGALRAVAAKATHARKLTAGCRDTFGRLVAERLDEVDALPSS